MGRSGDRVILVPTCDQGADGELKPALIQFFPICTPCGFFLGRLHGNGNAYDLFWREKRLKCGRGS